MIYTSPALGHLYPVVDTLVDLHRRGHEVHVRTLASEVPALRDLGLLAEPIAAEIESVPLDTWRAATPQEGLSQALATFAERSRQEITDLEWAIAEIAPDAVQVDITTVGRPQSPRRCRFRGHSRCRCSSSRGSGPEHPPAW